ncbi:unnamed protein product [Ascophyllum nodosum]
MSVIVFPRFRRHSLSCAGKLLLGALLLLLTIAACLGATVVGSGGGVKGIVQRKGDKAAEDFETADSDVVQITTENYTETIKQGTWFVKFYTDWCSHCKQFQPTWEELAKDLKGKVRVGQVNCETDRALCSRFHVKGYPTLVHVHNRKCRVYKLKSRSKGALIDFTEKGYKKTAAISALKSPFGPIESVKARLVEAIILSRKFVLEQVASGTPIWLLCIYAVSGLVVVTTAISLILVATKRPKQD